MYTEADCESRLTKILAPRTGDLRAELILELSEYFGRTPAEMEQQLTGATERFTDEWKEHVADPRDERAVTRFYNESKTELFDLAHWHTHDPIHYRALMCADITVASLKARTTRPAYLDYGSGIG